MKPGLIYLALSLTTTAIADSSVFKGGHAKYQFQLNTLPDDSLLKDYVDSPAIDNNADLRLKFGWQTDNISLASDYQIITKHGDSIRLANSLPASMFFNRPLTDDNNRLFDLTHIISEDNNQVTAHRLDRLYVDITQASTVFRFGRQAVSWGNGLIYTPMDFFNPFDPSAVDKEYKTGDDMFYTQYLTASGDDIQAVWVLRRNTSGDVSANVDSIAVKYHGFVGDSTNNAEFDLLLAEHYDDTIFGIGGVTDIGTALWRGDITLTHTGNTQSGSENIFSLVTSLSWSWETRGHNVSGIAEYFYNGFGQGDGDYSQAALLANPELTERILRGELFTLGRHYVALSAMIEMTPLWLLTPNVFINASDGSLLAQLVSSYDLKQDWQLLVALGVPAGSPGTEYGGVDYGNSGKQLSTGLNLFAQLAWYF